MFGYTTLLCRRAVLAVAAVSMGGSFLYGVEGLTYSGRTSWDANLGIVTFESDGAMPEAKEEFFWTVPAGVRKIVINAGVTVTGGFRVGYREPSNPLHLMGIDRESSVIHGTDASRWTEAHGIADNDKWKYGSVNVLADAVVHVTNLTSLNPRGYHISGYANLSVIHVDRCNLLDTRDGVNNNSDGFAGAVGSSIRDSLISTSDDAIKVYHDITIENVTIRQHRNGAPLQFGWGGETGPATAEIKQLTIRGVDPEHRYNMAPLTWEAGTRGVRQVQIAGLSVEIEGQMYDETDRRWRPIGLFELKPNGCEFNLRATGVRLTPPGSAHPLGLGIRNTRGTVELNGEIVSRDD